jgi:hypothetical protein
MGEFKFACPVCGQHITADSSTSGTQLDCPTCFRRIIVPQAPREGDPKLILAAAQPAKPRPPGFSTTSNLEPLRPRPARRPMLAVALWAVALCAAGLSVWVGRDRISTLVRGTWTSNQNPPTNLDTNLPPSVYPVPTHIQWSLDLTNATIPDAPAVGRISGAGYKCEQATLRGGELSLFQGQGTPTEFVVTVMVFAQQPQQLKGKTLVVLPSRAPPLPKVLLKWPAGAGPPVTKEFSGGYAMKLTFGYPTNGWFPGKIYLALPDNERSFVAGTFQAQVLKQ